MLSQKDIDQLEGYLCKATLNELPNVLMKVLPLLFAELRTMQSALDAQAENFFDGWLPRIDGRGRDDLGRVGDEGLGLLGGTETDAGPQAPRTADSIHAVQAVGPQRTDAASARGPSRQDQVGAGPVVHPGMVEPVGGEVRQPEGNGPVSGSQPDVAVKKRRGRPPKQSPVLDGVLGIEPITKQGGE